MSLENAISITTAQKMQKLATKFVSFKFLNLWYPDQNVGSGGV